MQRRLKSSNYIGINSIAIIQSIRIDYRDHFRARSGRRSIYGIKWAREESRFAGSSPEEGESVSSPTPTTDENCPIGKGYRPHSLPACSRTEMKQVDALVLSPVGTLIPVRERCAHSSRSGANFRNESSRSA